MQYTDGVKRYILAADGMVVGAKVLSGAGSDPIVGTNMPLDKIPLGMTIHNIEMVPGGGAKLCRAAGVGAGHHGKLELARAGKRRAVGGHPALVGDDDVLGLDREVKASHQQRRKRDEGSSGFDEVCFHVLFWFGVEFRVCTGDGSGGPPVD